MSIRVDQDNNLLHIKWVTHTDHMKDLLSELVSDNEFTDVTLVCDDKREIRAHKFVLSSCSPVFKNIIKNNDQNIPIFLKGIKYEDVIPLLQFFYIGQATVAAERMLPFLKLASNFKVKDLIRHIVKDTEKNQIKIINVNKKDDNKRLSIHRGALVDIAPVKAGQSDGSVQRLSISIRPSINIAGEQNRKEETNYSIEKESVRVNVRQMMEIEVPEPQAEEESKSGGPEMPEFGVSKNLLDIIDNIDVPDDEMFMSQNDDEDDLGDFDISDLCGDVLSENSQSENIDELRSIRKYESTLDDSENLNPQKSCPFICKWCGAGKSKWKTYSELIVHVKSVHKGYACCKCDFQTSDLLAFQGHVQESHKFELKNNQYKVPKVSRHNFKTKDRKIWEVQIRDKHGPNKDRKISKQKAPWKERTTIAKARRRECRLCEDVFTSEIDLNLHIRKYHEKHTLSCDLCDDFEYYSEAAIKIHKMKKHQGTKRV